MRPRASCIISGGIRTRDLWIRSPARYPLRYGDIHFVLCVLEQKLIVFSVCGYEINKNHQVLPRLELGSLDSKSRVLTITP